MTGPSDRGRSCFVRPILVDDPAARRTADTFARISPPFTDELSNDTYRYFFGGYRTYIETDRSRDPAGAGLGESFCLERPEKEGPFAPASQKSYIPGLCVQGSPQSVKVVIVSPCCDNDIDIT